MSAHDGGYERSDANIPFIWKFVAGLFLLILLTLLLMLVMFRYLSQEPASADLPVPTPMEANRVLPPAPRLQVGNAGDFEQLRKKEEEALNQYGWVDKNAGIVRIPVSRAMELLAERGLTAKKAAAKSRENASKKK